MVFQLILFSAITVLGLTAFFMLRHMRKHNTQSAWRSIYLQLGTSLQHPNRRWSKTGFFAV